MASNPSPLIWRADESNIHIRPMCFDRARSLHSGHLHNWDHTSIVYTGQVQARAKFPDGRVHVEEFKAPAFFLVDKDVEHEITCTRPTDTQVIAEVEAMTPQQLREKLIALMTVPTQVWCVYAHRDPSGEVIQRNIGWDRAYGWTPDHV